MGTLHRFDPLRAVERRALRWLLSAAGRPQVRIVLWDGEEFGASRSSAPIVRVRDRATLWRMLSDPDVEFGDAYAEGRMEVEGDLLRFLLRLFEARWSPTPLDRLHPSRLLRRLRANGLSRAQQNVHAHYDLGNDFYRLWLDERMVYTCAYFTHPSVSLEEAQFAKLDYVCRKLALRPGESVVEAGCGWGALALHMARHYGVSVRAFNVSPEQIAWARDAARREGLESRVEFIEDDYRNVTGRYDAFVSVGMLEHVGKRHYPDLRRVIDRCLSEEGRGLLHSIGRNRAQRMNSWIERRIFPGSYLPTLGEMATLLEQAGFSVLDAENLRLHYARTLLHWLERFEKNAGHVAERFDERFVRSWRLYLAGSIASFQSGGLQLFQLVFARPRLNAIPWTRARLYAE